MFPLIQSLFVFQSDDRMLFIVTNILLFAAGVLIAWTPSVLLRNFVFKKPLPWWAGVAIAAVTLLLAMGAGILLTGRERPAIHATAAVLAYFTVTQHRKQKQREAAE